MNKHAHQLARNGIADKEAQAQNAHNCSVRLVREPLGTDFDEPGPADGLNEAIPDPRNGEDGQRMAAGEDQGKQDGAREPSDEAATATPEIG
jgi:hypothetical protein